MGHHFTNYSTRGSFVFMYDLSISNKLVRDKIPEIRRREGWVVVEKVLASYEHSGVFEAKLREELLEFRKAESRKNEMEEVIDMWAVIEGIKFWKLNIDQNLFQECEEILENWMKFFENELKDLRSKKAVAKGEFEGLHYIVSETRTITA